MGPFSRTSAQQQAPAAETRAADLLQVFRDRRTPGPGSRVPKEGETGWGGRSTPAGTFSGFAPAFGLGDADVEPAYPVGNVHPAVADQSVVPDAAVEPVPPGPPFRVSKPLPPGTDDCDEVLLVTDCWPRSS
jgi:hypothetical protein